MTRNTRLRDSYHPVSEGSRVALYNGQAVNLGSLPQAVSACAFQGRPKGLRSEQTSASPLVRPR